MLCGPRNEEAKALLGTGIGFSISFGLLEGCVTATINLSHAVVQGSIVRDDPLPSRDFIERAQRLAGLLGAGRRLPRPHSEALSPTVFVHTKVDSRRLCGARRNRIRGS